MKSPQSFIISYLHRSHHFLTSLFWLHLLHRDRFQYPHQSEIYMQFNEEHHKTSAKFQSSHIFIEIRTFLELEFILRLIHKCSGVTKSIRNFLHRPIVSRLIYPQELMSSRLLANNTVWI